MPPTLWDVCSEEGCRGARLSPYGRCLAHLDDHAFAEYLGVMAATRRVDARGVTVTEARAGRLVSALGDPDAQVWRSARFDEATFEGNVWFYGATFESASFFKAVFKGEAMFDHATFHEEANFMGGQFASTRDWATFSEATFCASARFDGAVFSNQLHLSKATVTGVAAFVHARFMDIAALEHAEFTGGLDCREATFDTVVNLEGSKVEGPTEFGLAVFNGQLKLKRLELDPGPLALARVHFSAGVHIDLDGVRLTLEGSDFSGPSLLRGTGGAARVMSVEDADVGNLVLTGVDLRACRFRGARNLDRLRFEDVTPFAPPPARLGPRWQWPPLWRWTSRQVIAEEHAWRLENDSVWRAGALADEVYRSQAPACDGSAVLSGDGVSQIYRSLRKGREDNGDAPGASDFYYGEMEMRRHDSHGAERFVLSGYWLLSGYALRSSRAIIGFVLAVVLFAVLFDVFGIRPTPGFNTAITYSIQTATNWFGTNFAPPVQLSGWGEAFEVLLRVLGPLLLGLAVVSLRGRVTR